MEKETEFDTQEQEIDTVVELAKTQGTAIWEHGCKLGYIIRHGAWFYAVTEILTHKGLQYSHSRHGSFFLAQEELRERSWEVA